MIPTDPTEVSAVSVALADADLGAAKPIERPTPTSKEISEYRARYFTVRHSTVVACGHKIDVRHFPTQSNCPSCWEAFFELNPEGVAASHDILLNQGTKTLIAMHGKKFIKMLGEHLRKKLLQMASPKVQASSGIEGSVMSIAEEKGANLGIR